MANHNIPPDDLEIFDDNDGTFTDALSIGAYVHCAQCVQEIADGHIDAIGQAPATYARLAVGWTEHGLQVWCERHQANVVHIHFQGMAHPAIITSGALIDEDGDGDE